MKLTILVEGYSNKLDPAIEAKVRAYIDKYLSQAQIIGDYTCDIKNGVIVFDRPTTKKDCRNPEQENEEYRIPLRYMDGVLSKASTYKIYNAFGAYLPTKLSHSEISKLAETLQYEIMCPFRDKLSSVTNPKININNPKRTVELDSGDPNNVRLAMKDPTSLQLPPSLFKALRVLGQQQNRRKLDPQFKDRIKELSKNTTSMNNRLDILNAIIEIANIEYGRKIPPATKTELNIFSKIKNLPRRLYYITMAITRIKSLLKMGCKSVHHLPEINFNVLSFNYPNIEAAEWGMKNCTDYNQILILRDSYRMAKQLNQPLVLRGDFRNLQRQHDEMAHRISIILNEKLAGAVFTSDILKNKTINDIHLIYLDTASKMYDEGKVMHHCVATYAESALNGSYAAYSIIKDGQHIGTISLFSGKLDRKLTTSNMLIDDLRGAYNAELPGEVTIQVRELVESNKHI